MLTVPKIVFPSGGGTTLTLQYPPKNLPYKTYDAVRHDNVASSGAVERIYERRDEFLNIFMEYVKTGADVAGWDAFLQYALAGGSFDYYPDSTSGSSDIYILTDTTWNAAFKQLGMYTFSMKLRKAVSDTGIGGGFHGESLTFIASYTYAGLPATAPAGALGRVSDAPGGIWMYSGIQWVKVGPVNVKDAPYNAKGDDSTDDTAAFTLAAATSNRIYAPAGIYQLQTFDVLSNCLIYGDGQGLTVLKAMDGAELDIMLNVPTTATSVRIRDLTIDGNRDNQGMLDGFSAPCNIGGTNVTLEEVEITGGTFVGAFVGATVAIAKGVTFKGCYIHDNGGVTDDTGHGCGIFSGGAMTPEDISILDCVIKRNYNTVTKPNDSSGVNLTVKGLRIQGCLFEDNFNVAGGQVVLNGSIADDICDGDISDLMIRATTNFGTPADRTAGIEIQCKKLIVSRITMRLMNTDETGISIGTEAAASGGDVTISDCDIEGVGVGIGLSPNTPLSNVTVTGCRVNAAIGIGTDDTHSYINIEGNDFSKCAQAQAGTVSSTTNMQNNLPFTVSNSPNGRTHVQSVAAASATHMTLGNGNSNNVSGTTDIELINADGWVVGDIVFLWFSDSLTVKNAIANSGSFYRIYLDGNVDLAVNADDTLTLQWVGYAWVQISNSVNV